MDVFLWYGSTLGGTALTKVAAMACLITMAIHEQDKFKHHIDTVSYQSLLRDCVSKKNQI